MAVAQLHDAPLPAPGTYEIDPTHSSVTFSVRHLMVAKVRGHFAVKGGRIEVEPDPLASSVVATVDAGSVDTRDANRDAHLRSADFFDVEHHPEISFRSSGVEQVGPGEYRLHGELTIRDVTRPIALTVEYLGAGKTLEGRTTIGFSATTTLNRKDWGLEWNVALESGGVLVGDKITLTIDVEAVK